MGSGYKGRGGLCTVVGGVWVVVGAGLSGYSTRWGAGYSGRWGAWLGLVVGSGLA